MLIEHDADLSAHNKDWEQGIQQNGSEEVGIGRRGKRETGFGFRDRPVFSTCPWLIRVTYSCGLYRLYHLYYIRADLDRQRRITVSNFYSKARCGHYSDRRP